MAKYYACLLIQRVLFPTLLAACSFFRPVALSFLYLLMLLWLPFVPVATPGTIKERTGKYFKILILISILTCLSHGIFEIILASIGSESCDLTVRIFRHIGFIELGDLPGLSVLLWISPEIVMLLSSMGFFILLNRMAVKNTEVTNAVADTDAQDNKSEPGNIQDSIEFHSVTDDEEPSLTQERMSLLIGVAKTIAIVTLLLAAATRPSVPSAVYFLIYLGLGSWWACYRSLGKGFAVILRVVMVFASIHVIVIMLYQMPGPQKIWPANELVPRLFGLTPIFLSSCANSTVVQTDGSTFANITIPDDIRVVTFNSYASVDQVLNPMIILLCFYVMALTSSLLLGPQVQYVETFLPKRQSTKEMKATDSQLRDDSVEEEDTTPLDEIDKNKKSDVMERLTVYLERVTTFIFKNCYIFMNVAMMAWSIVYHSWLTFVLLLWANILWIIPNQRKAMFRSSPFVVIYAQLLLLAQYVFSIGIPDDILPKYVGTIGINLEQIGFAKFWHMPGWPVILKSAFTLMFWITLRQWVLERKQQKKTPTPIDMEASLRVSVGATTAETPRVDTEQKDQRFITKLLAFFNYLLVRFWIWIVCIYLFVSGIGGQKITGFRIIYMALFLVFLLTFQISRRFWKKILYGFWLIVIIYAMTILVLVYTYQFDKFSDYWEKYIGISKALQEDIGLEIYQTRDMFLHLLISTIVVIMAILQLHYFHSKFISLIKRPRPKETEPQVQPSLTSELNHDLQNKEEENFEGSKKKGFFKKIAQINGVSQKKITSFSSAAKKKIKPLYELSLLFLEFHLIKLIIFMGFWLTVKDPCVVHILIFVVTVVAALVKTNIQIFMSRIISVSIGILLLVKMIYQVTYIRHSDFDVDCENTTESGLKNTTEWMGFYKIEENTTESGLKNTAEWMGFYKIEDGSNLPSLVGLYIAYIILVTADVVIRMRQQFVRLFRGQPKESPLVMFIEITRKEADNDLRDMLKYLANYGFYKFGVEICLICTVILIGLRMDMIALFYALWLSSIFYVNREKLSSYWPFFKWFIAISLIVQYIVIVGAPPSLCINYPWEEELLKNVQIWVMLPDVSLINSTDKLIPEFILLMVVTRQTMVFTIEKEFSKSQTEYNGGTNDPIIADIPDDSDTKYINPTPDFTTTQRNWLDILKYGFLLGCFWLSLSIAFLTGIKRMDLFSLGYLIGSFIFLWQGSDFYLRPIDVITKWWIRFIGYNIFVIASMVVLQIPGCLFYNALVEKCLWLIQLLSIECLQRENPEKTSVIGETGVENDNEANIYWDVVCFVFLIIQYRIFQSHYFFYIINDTKASKVLASRGAELIRDLKKKEMEAEMEHESKILNKLKINMDRIKASQKKLLESGKQPKTHAQATRSGDYYMFEKFDDQQELILFPKKKPDNDYVEDSTKSKFAKKKKFSLLRTFFYKLFVLEGVDELNFEEGGDENGEDSTNSKHDKKKEEDVAEQSNKKSDESDVRLSTPFRRSVRTQKSDRSLGGVSEDEIQLQKTPDLSAKSESKKDEADNEDKTNTDRSREIPEEKSPTLKYDRVKTEGKSRKKNRDNESEEEDDTIDLKNARPEKGSVSQFFKLIWAYVENLMISIIIRLNKISRHYRYIMRVLAREKYELKKSICFDDRHREGDSEGDQRKRTHVVPEIRIHAPLLEHGIDELPGTSTQMSSPKINQKVIQDKRIDENKDFSEKEHSTIVELLMAIWFVILSHTDLVCYLMVFINHIVSASLLSLPLPFMVFFWGTLTIPRPSKRFWVTLIIYTQFVVVVKCIFQFGLIYWNENPIPPNLPLAPARILGIEKKEGYASYDLALLLILCFHRFMLKSLGLWKSDFKEEPLTEDVDEIEDPSKPVNGKRYWFMNISQFNPNNNIQDEQKKPVPSIMKAKNTLLRLWKPDSKEKSLTEIIDEVEDSCEPGLEKRKEVMKTPQLDRNNQSVDKPKDPKKPVPSVINIKNSMLGLWKSNFKGESNAKGTDDIKNVSKPDHVQQNEVIENDQLHPDNVSGDIQENPEKSVPSIIKAKNSLLGLWKSNVKNGTMEITRIKPDNVLGDIQDHQKKHVPQFVKNSLKHNTSSIKRYFGEIFDSSSRVSADLYVYMFFCDFFNFLVVIFGFTSFGRQQGDGGVAAYFEENRVPVAFLIMLILQFVLIIVDRALYLRKFMLGKLIFQYALILGIHIWMFFVLPGITERSFNANSPPVIWYMVKCIYLLLSAYQIRCGYPSRTLGNFLTRSFSNLNSMAHKVYMFIPFLFELRTLMDWIWTDTTMTLSDWLKMEDIFAIMYQLKCSRKFEEEFPAPRAQKKKPASKYAMGGGMLFGLIGIIMLPLILFALGSTVGKANPPFEVSVSMKIGPYEPVYTAQAQGPNIRQFDEEDWEQLNIPYNRDLLAVTFLATYQADDVAVVDFGSNSISTWSISPPDQERLIKDLEQNVTLTMVFHYTLSRTTYSSENPGIISEQASFDLEPGDSKREILSGMLNGTSGSIEIPYMLPKFMKVSMSGSLKPIPQLIPREYGKMAGDRNITLSLHNSSGDPWWEMKENCSDDFSENVLTEIPFYDCNETIVFYTFNDKLFPATLSFLTAGGIIGMYTTFIIVISRVIRGSFGGSSSKIMFDDLPNVDRILQLCLDIYMVRELMEFGLEEDLFAKLMFLYRSSETMIEYTKPKEEDRTRELHRNEEVLNRT